jgi:hypothetical protein
LGKFVELAEPSSSSTSDGESSGGSGKRKAERDLGSGPERKKAEADPSDDNDGIGDSSSKGEAKANPSDAGTSKASSESRRRRSDVSRSRPKIQKTSQISTAGAGEGSSIGFTRSRQEAGTSMSFNTSAVETAAENRLENEARYKELLRFLQIGPNESKDSEFCKKLRENLDCLNDLYTSTIKRLGVNSQDKKYQNFLNTLNTNPNYLNTLVPYAEEREIAERDRKDDPSVAALLHDPSLGVIYYWQIEYRVMA